MTVNATNLSDNHHNLLGLGASAYGPGISVLVDAQSTAGGAAEVMGGIGVEGGEAFRVRDDGLLVLVETGLGELVGRGDGRPEAQRFGDFFAGAQEDLVDAEVGVRQHWGTNGQQQEKRPQRLTSREWFPQVHAHSRPLTPLTRLLHPEYTVT